MKRKSENFDEQYGSKVMKKKNVVIEKSWKSEVEMNEVSIVMK